MPLTLYPRTEPGGRQGVGSPAVELSPAFREKLLDPAAWQEGLEQYARATNLAVTLTDVDGRPLSECINPQPTWGLFQGQKPANTEACPFVLMTAAPCACGADALSGSGFRLARDRTELVHFAVPLLLGDHALGALVAGQAFDQYPEQLALEHAARQRGLSPAEVWQVARLEHPLKASTLHVYADLLATLSDHTLRSRYHTFTEAERLSELTGLSEQLRQRTQELGEANRRKDEFLAMLAHELRNPLAPIRNAIQVMRLLAKEDVNLCWAGDVVERQVQHMSRLVDDLLDVSRFTSGKITLQKEPTDLAAVVARAVEAARPAIEERRQEMSVALPPELMRVEGDPIRLAQVVGNLLNNAAKYTPEGGRIWLTARREGNTAVVSVRDTGVGIAADMLPRVFDLFAQADRSLAHSEGGLGVGLTLVKSLVELHGGSVEAHSPGPNRGSEFVVRLPLLADGQRPSGGEEPGDAQAVPLPPRRILVVDDNVDSAESLAVLLRLQGHEVEVAHDGATALAAAQTFRPQAVLLDIGLPGMDGYEVARRLRQQSVPAEMLLVAVTGYCQEEDRRRSQEAGFNAHLVKPVCLGTLHALLARTPAISASS
jgi:signal transduction histidine kinase/ActR/RegA family two-component response regulator